MLVPLGEDTTANDGRANGLNVLRNSLLVILLKGTINTYTVYQL